VLQAKGIEPRRPLEEDQKLTDQSMSYDGGAVRRSKVEVRNNPLTGAQDTGSATVPRQADDSVAGEPGGWPCRSDGSPDFDRMSPAQRTAYHAARLKQSFG
jgi:hypothetical protein